MHLSDGTLRRWIDEPLSIDAAQRRHLEFCERCRRRGHAVERDAESAQRLLTSSITRCNVEAGLRSVRARVAVPDVAAAKHELGGFGRMRFPRWARWSAVPVGAIALSLALVVSGAAQSFFMIFQPKQFSAVSVTAADVTSLVQLTRYGTVSGVPNLRVTEEPSAAAAAHAAGIAAPHIASLPSNVTGAAHYAVIPGGVVSFTFSAQKAADAAARQGASLPPMPSHIDGTTLTVTIPPVIILSYGTDVSTVLTRGVDAISSNVLVAAAERAPVVTSTGATADQLENYLLSQPGVPADLAAEIRSLGDPSSTVPVPIPLDGATSQQVDISGAHGLLIGDSTGIASLVVWEADGVVRVVGGDVTSDQVLAAARSIR